MQVRARVMQAGLRHLPIFNKLRSNANSFGAHAFSADQPIDLVTFSQ